MQALQVLAEVQRRNVELWPAGEYLEFSPASALTPDLIDGLRENKEFILEHLKRREERRQDTSPKIANAGEVLDIAREVLPELKEEDRVDLDELIQANSPPPPGRDPMVKRNTDKARFFKGNWREAWPQDFEAHKEDDTPPMPPTEAEERAITREVHLLLAKLHPVEVRDGRIVVPEGASVELAERVRKVEGELLWATGRESGPRWGCSWVPARTEVPVVPLKRRRRVRSWSV